MSRRWRIVGWVVGGVLVTVFVLSATTTWVRDALMWPLVVDEPLRPSDVIVVLGAGTRPDGVHLPPQALQRTLRGIALHQQGVAPRVIFSGGRDRRTGYVESNEMLAYAASQGFPSADGVTEGSSHDTWGNATFTLEIMRQQGWRTAAVVTSPYHTWRACRMFRRQGADVRCHPAPFSLLPQTSVYERLMDTRGVIREYGAIVLAWMQGRL